mmetsp:Transcript_113551/g.321561  ORF Transcript_113551/g.321561 Transcript_113551/m.321561 type:complete len:119 (-) Transcript_113551:97-453(-)
MWPGARGSRAAGRLHETLLKYGKVGLVVHFSFSTLSLAGCYTAVCYQLPVERLLERIGLAMDRPGDGGGDASVAPPAALTRGSSAMLAFVLHKTLFPVRAPITVALTPLVARAFPRML